MSETNLLEQLRQVLFFSEVDEEHLQQIAAMARRVEFPAGKVIFREGQVAGEIYVILSGSVSLELCAPGVGCKRIMTVGAGDLLGISPVLGQTRMTATARTVAPTQALQLNVGQILTLCEHNPRFGYEFMRRAALAVAKRLNATRLQLIDVFGAQMPDVAGVRRDEG